MLTMPPISLASETKPGVQNTIQIYQKVASTQSTKLSLPSRRACTSRNLVSSARAGIQPRHPNVGQWHLNQHLTSPFSIRILNASFNTHVFNLATYMTTRSILWTCCSSNLSNILLWTDSLAQTISPCRGLSKSC